MSSRTRLPVILVVALLAGTLSLPVASAQATQVTLTPVTAGTVAQGHSFEFKVRVENTGGSSQTVTVVQRLEPLTAAGAPVDFVDRRFVVPAGASRSANEEVSTGQYYAGIGTFRITPYIGGAPAGPPLDFEVGNPPVLPATFADVTSAAGVGTTPLPAPQCDGQLTAGAAWADYDNDGDLDLYVPLPHESAKLFINDGSGQFTDQAAMAGVTNAGSIGRAAVAADYDNDGDQDLYVVNEGPARLYRNNGNKTFTEVPNAAGASNDDNGPLPSFGTSASWGDYDNDGLLDLFVTNYGGHETAECPGGGQDDKLYRQLPDHTFQDVTHLLENGPGCADGCTVGYGFQGAWFDYDKDGDLDLYLANDYNDWLPAPEANHLWRNNLKPTGQATFTDVTAAANAAPPDLQSMGIGIADSDGDLDLDLAISDIAGNKALRNNGDGTFTETADAVNLDRPWEFAQIFSITWGLGFYDFNLDTWEDLYVASGAILVPGQGTTGPRYNQLFMNTGTGAGGYADLSVRSGASSGEHSRGVAFADYNADGRMDMYVVNHLGSPILYQNTTPTAGLHWIEVDPEGRPGGSNRDGCGAAVILWVGGKRLLRQVFCGSTSLGTGNDPFVHFGLGSATKIDRMMILWPSGRRQVRNNVPMDVRITVREPAA